MVPAPVDYPRALLDDVVMSYPYPPGILSAPLPVRGNGAFGVWGGTNNNATVDALDVTDTNYPPNVYTVQVDQLISGLLSQGLPTMPPPYWGFAVRSGLALNTAFQLRVWYHLGSSPPRSSSKLFGYFQIAAY
jgi:hypothetical protein